MLFPIKNLFWKKLPRKLLSSQYVIMWQMIRLTSVFLSFFFTQRFKAALTNMFSDQVNYSIISWAGFRVIFVPLGEKMEIILFERNRLISCTIVSIISSAPYHIFIDNFWTRVHFTLKFWENTQNLITHEITKNMEPK